MTKTTDPVLTVDIHICSLAKMHTLHSISHYLTIVGQASTFEFGFGSVLGKTRVLVWFVLAGLWFFPISSHYLTIAGQASNMHSPSEANLTPARVGGG